MAKDKTARPDKPAKPFEAVIGKNPKPAKPAKPVKPAKPAKPVKVPVPTVFVTGPSFAALAGDEVGALVSAETVLSFLKARALELANIPNGAVLQWATGALLKAIGVGIPGDIERIKELVEQVLEAQKEILAGLDKLLTEVDFNTLITVGYPAVERITSIYEELVVISGLEDPAEQKREADRIRTDILNSNLGTTLNLKTINDVLLGKQGLGGTDALINLFAKRWLPVYLAQQVRPEVPLSTYPSQLDAWLHGLFVVQYMGLAEYANARIANGDFGSLRAQVETTIRNMEAQKALLEESIPAFTRTLPDALFDGRYYVVRQVDFVRGRPFDTDVLYGSPEGDNYAESTAVKFRSRHRDNSDEEWQFEKTGETDTFIMHERSQRRLVYVTVENAAQKDQVKVNVKGSAQTMRFVMGRTEDPNANPNAKIRDLYLPVFLFVRRGDFLTVRGHPVNVENITFAGPLNQAVRVLVDYAGH